MKTPFVLIAFLISLNSFNLCSAQVKIKDADVEQTKKDIRTLVITSLNGKKEMVDIIPDYANHVLIIRCRLNKICISNFWGVSPEIRLLNRSFIRITYHVRGGSNMGLANTLVLCVDKGKLYESLHIINHVRWESGDLTTNYDVNLRPAKSKGRTYRLTALIHDNVLSTRAPETNYEYRNKTILSFDSKNKAFYSIKKDLYSYHIKGVSKQKVSGNFPIVILGKENYYFINQRWYQLENNQVFNEIK